MFEYLLKHSSSIILVFELLSALIGTFFIFKFKEKEIKYFCYFLWLTFFIEVIGNYPIYIDNFYFLNPLKDTVFKRNFWLFNLYGISQILFYLFFYLKVVDYKFSKKILKGLFLVYTLFAAFNLLFRGQDFFLKYINDNFYSGTFCVLVCVFVFFYEMLNSNKILVFYNSFAFYVSIGLLVWWLVFPPLIVYYGYYNPIYPEFIKIRNIILLLVNVFVYTCFIFGFICHKRI